MGLDRSNHHQTTAINTIVIMVSMMICFPTLIAHLLGRHTPHTSYLYPTTHLGNPFGVSLMVMKEVSLGMGADHTSRDVRHVRYDGFKLRFVRGDGLKHFLLSANTAAPKRPRHGCSRTDCWKPSARA